jgi:tetratricopeptide (TPR) repeat protein
MDEELADTMIPRQWQRFIGCALFGAVLSFGQLKQREKEPQQQQEPPEEDETLKPKEYGFNPLQASKEIKTGLFYKKKKSWKAAARRFEEALKWDPNSGEAYLNLGEVLEKTNDKEGAKQAYTKYLEIEPDSKLAPALKKKFNIN